MTAIIVPTVTVTDDSIATRKAIARHARRIAPRVPARERRVMRIRWDEIRAIAKAVDFSPIQLAGNAHIQLMMTLHTYEVRGHDQLTPADVKNLTTDYCGYAKVSVRGLPTLLRDLRYDAIERIQATKKGFSVNFGIIGLTRTIEDSADRKE
jgi:hypothetical protein